MHLRAIVLRFKNKLSKLSPQVSLIFSLKVTLGMSHLLWIPFLSASPVHGPDHIKHSCSLCGDGNLSFTQLYCYWFIGNNKHIRIILATPKALKMYCFVKTLKLEQ